MTQKTKRLIAAVLAATLLAVTAIIAVESDMAAAAIGDDRETPITGGALDKASTAALTHVGEGRVTDTEVGDEEGYYEVEITLDDGSQVDVHLDESFTVLGQEADSDNIED